MATRREPKKFRKCPHCKSNKGFSINISLGGYIEEKRTFSGKVLDSEKRECDTIDNYGECLNCKRLIPAENLNHDN